MAEGKFPRPTLFACGAVVDEAHFSADSKGRGVVGESGRGDLNGVQMIEEQSAHRLAHHGSDAVALIPASEPRPRLACADHQVVLCVETLNADDVTVYSDNEVEDPFVGFEAGPTGPVVVRHGAGKLLGGRVGPRLGEGHLVWWMYSFTHQVDQGPDVVVGDGAQLHVATLNTQREWSPQIGRHNHVHQCSRAVTLPLLDLRERLSTLSSTACCDWLTSVHLDQFALIVDDYDAAIRFFVDALGFELVEDSPSVTNDGRPKRWVVVRPPGATSALLLALADGERQMRVVGDQFAGRVGLFLRVDDFDATYHRMQRAGVQFVTEPRYEPYGRVVVFVDMAGNRWDLLGPSPDTRLLG